MPPVARINEAIRVMLTLLTRCFAPGGRYSKIVSHDPSFKKLKQAKRLKQDAQILK